ncbi:Fatty acid hydroxylase [Corchorus capsularis]|uniref:Fatty acid hydroxylase n=1 Tax=Corchorus capsularis TaxID=210143 RepID=A0A1R3IE39_COCAP|nr:Fatty acid hydroxylase [Corchorus capsularis]
MNDNVSYFDDDFRKMQFLTKIRTDDPCRPKRAAYRGEATPLGRLTVAKPPHWGGSAVVEPPLWEGSAVAEPNSDYMAKFKVQPKMRSSFSDMFKCYKYVMKIFIFVVGPLQILSVPTFKLVGIRTSLPLPSMWEILSQLVVYFLIEDYTNYWLHRLLHCEWGYEKIHYVHHKYSAPFGFAASHSHWAETVILGIPTLLGPTMVPCHMITLSIWTILRQVEAIQTHSGYEFPWNPTNLIPFYVGAEYHDYHHFVGRQSQSNFASVFTYCDYIYGTDRGYRRHKQALNKVHLGVLQGKMS